MRPKVIRQEREKLYDDALRQKMTANLLKDENVKLKTKVHILESELLKKERLIDDLLMQQEGAGGYQGQMMGSQTTKNSGVKLESHLATNLKRKIKELQANVNTKSNEVE